MPIAQESEVFISKTNLLMISGIPIGKVEGDSLVIIDDNKYRAQARGGKAVEVKIAHIIKAIQRKRSMMQS